MRAYRHGDVVIRELSDEEYGAITRCARPSHTWKKAKNLTLAEGEVTGHSHQLKADEKMIAWKGTADFNWEARQLDFTPRLAYRVVGISEEMSLTHEEHAEIKLPKGNYIVYQQREQWSKQAARAVYD